MRAMIDAPPHLRQIVQDPGAVRKQLRQLDFQIEKQSPKAYPNEVLDSAVAREKQLREEFTEGMPTQEEMRKRPAGAVDKNLSWERRNKLRIMEWKNIRLRLQQSGAMSSMDAQDVASIEQYRPRGGTGELPMHGTLIAGKDFHLPPIIEVKNVAPDEDKERFRMEKLVLIERLAKEGDPMYQKLWKQIEGAGQARRSTAKPKTAET